MADHDALVAENEMLKAENTVLKERNSVLEKELETAQSKNQHMQMIVSGLGVSTVLSAAAADEASRRAAVSEGVHKNTQQIRNVEAQIAILKTANDALRKENEALRAENVVLRQQNKALEERCDQLTRANDELDTRIKVLEMKIEKMETSFSARDAMRDLEFCICRDAAKVAGVSTTQFRKKKLFNFAALARHTPPIPLPDWAKKDDMHNLIVHYKKAADPVVHGPVTEEVVRASIIEKDDDAEDVEVKEQMIVLLKQYYDKEGTPFGHPVKRP